MARGDDLSDRPRTRLPDPHRHRPVRQVLGGGAAVVSWCVQVAGCALVGALCWAWWLRTPQEPSGDYSAGQVTACVVTLVLVCVVLAMSVNPIAVVVGLTAGFTAAWTRNAASSDPTGLYLVGSVLVAVGLGLGSALLSAAASALARRATGPGAGT